MVQLPTTYTQLGSQSLQARNTAISLTGWQYVFQISTELSILHQAVTDASLPGHRVKTIFTSRSENSRSRLYTNYGYNGSDSSVSEVVV